MADRWYQVSVVLAGEREIEAATLFEELGALAVTTVGDSGSIWLEKGVSDSPEWGRVEVTGLFDGDVDVHALCQTVGVQLKTETHSLQLADQDWVRQSQRLSGPLKVGRGLWICPSWHDMDESSIIIRLDPGLAFGSGSHPTTAMCLDWLSRMPKTTGNVLDYGCGSGVLSIGALLLGFEHATGVDIDDQAIRASAENAANNGVGERMLVLHPDQLQADFRADVVVANILAGTIASLSQQLIDRVKPGGWLVLSGILSDQAVAVKENFDSDLQFVRWQRQQWILLATRKSPNK